jgi:Uma2 family endonuclease
MATLTIPIEMVRRFSREDYYRMRDQGLLSRHTELIEGVLVDKMTISPRHIYIASKFRSWIESLKLPGMTVKQESPITIGNSEPEPDISVVLGKLEDYRDAHPTTAKWVIEVAISSLSLHLSKRKIYAEAHIPHYWIIDPENNRILVFGEPEGDGYKKETIYGTQDEIPVPLVEGQTVKLDWI